MFSLHYMARGDYPGWVWPNPVSPLKAEFSTAGCRGGSQIFEAWEWFDKWFTALKIDRTTWQGMLAALWAERDPWLTFCKETGTSVLQLRWNELSNLNEQIFPRLSRWEFNPANSLISASWYPKQRSQLSHALQNCKPTNECDFKWLCLW